MSSQPESSAAPEPRQPAKPAPNKKRENPWLNIGLNVAVPALLLMKGRDWLGPFIERFVGDPYPVVIVLALLFPLAYGLYDFAARRKANIFSIIGFVSVLLTGGIALFLPAGWIAWKEAAIPLLIGLAILISLKTPYPLVRTILLNPEIIDVSRVRAALEASGSGKAFERLLTSCTLLLSASFFLSAVLNYTLAELIIQSPTGTPAFEQELGRMTALSFPVIVLPSMVITFLALWKLLTGITRLTGLKFEDIFHPEATGEGKR